MLIAVNFHYVRSSFDYPYPGIHGVIPGQLEDQLSLLGKAGVFVGASQIRDAIREVAPLPDKALVVTFDDGLREQYETAWPVLQRLGIPAIFFVNTAPIAHATISSVHKIHLIRAHFDPGQVLTLLHRKARGLGIAMDMHIDDAKVIGQYKYDKLDTSLLK
ncbi:MAG: polysaccharide deacetylase family protein [Nitrospiraceae bacterium]